MLKYMKGAKVGHQKIDSATSMHIHFIDTAESLGCITVRAGSSEIAAQRVSEILEGLALLNGREQPKLPEPVERIKQTVSIEAKKELCMQPLAIMILMHYYHQDDDYKCESTSESEMLASLERRGYLVKSLQAPGPHQILYVPTLKLIAYCDALCAVQEPVQHWTVL